MEEQELVRINLQLPASALDSLSRLAEQLHLLTAAIAGRPEFSPQQAHEFGESTSFDPAQFQSLQLKTEISGVQRTLPLEQTGAPITGTQAVVPVHTGETEEVQAPDSTDYRASEYGEGHVQEAVPSSSNVPDAETAASSVSAEYALQPEQKVSTGAPEDVPAVRPVTEENPNFPTVQPESKGRTPEPEEARAYTVSRDTLPSLVRTEAGTETSPGAGTAIPAGADMQQSRWSGITEELATPGPAPLTAESVSLAFQRDGRRYDNGFPLY